MRADEVKTSAGREGRRPEENRRGALRHTCLRMEPSTAERAGPARRFAGRRPLRFAFFLHCRFLGKGRSWRRDRRFAGRRRALPKIPAPPALPRRLPRDAERMRAAEELRLFADLWTHAATPLVSVPASLASDSAFPAPGRGLIGIGCPSLESDSVLWTRTSRPPRLAQRSRWPGVTSLGTGRRVSRVGASSGLRRDVLCSGRTVPGIRFRAPGTRVGVPSGKVGGVFPCARTQAGPPVGEGLGGGSRSGFFSCANRGSGCFKECFLENQCIMEGSHKLSCGKATMRPTHTNRPTT